MHQYLRVASSRTACRSTTTQRHLLMCRTQPRNYGLHHFPVDIVLLDELVIRSFSAQKFSKKRSNTGIQPKNVQVYIQLHCYFLKERTTIVLITGLSNVRGNTRLRPRNQPRGASGMLRSVHIWELHDQALRREGTTTFPLSAIYSSIHNTISAEADGGDFWT